MGCGSSGGTETPRASEGMQIDVNGKYLDPNADPRGVWDPGIEVPIGDDERRKVEDTEVPPWCRIVQLSYHMGGASRGTGWMAGPRTIITAGHCVLDKDKSGDSGWATRMEATPGRLDADTTPFGVITDGMRLDAHPKWKDGREQAFDIGCIHLDEPVDSRIGQFQFGPLDDDMLEEACINVAGYPLIGPGRKRLLGMVPYFHEDMISEVKDELLYYEVDTWGGQSGSPVWLRLSAQEPPQVVGIHAYGKRDTHNFGPRITDEIKRHIEDWIAESGAPAVS